MSGVTQLPQEPLQPSLPHPLFTQLGVQGPPSGGMYPPSGGIETHWPVVWLQVPVVQVPHTPPQPSGPHERPVHCLVHPASGPGLAMHCPEVVLQV